MVLIIVAFVIAAAGVPSPRLGMDAAYRTVPCADNVIGECLSNPGFHCIGDYG